MFVYIIFYSLCVCVCIIQLMCVYIILYSLCVCVCIIQLMCVYMIIQLMCVYVYRHMQTYTYSMSVRAQEQPFSGLQRTHTYKHMSHMCACVYVCTCI
jgi:hypothetical protein